MTNETLLLAGTALTIGFFHTLFGPDHYIPFIVMARARKWTLWKTIWITTLSGLGHVGSSVVIGILGIAAGFGISRIEGLETTRGDLAAYAFILFGFVYMLYGIWRAIKNKPHKHFHDHIDGTKHTHEHTHYHGHNHPHSKSITPWILFTIFVLGPCEPLIPILMYPAAKESVSGLIFVTLVFAIVTISTMLAIVLTGYFGFRLINFGKAERYMHALAGAMILLSGIAIVMGL